MAFVTTNYLNDAMLMLGREEFVRPMVFGARWRFVRIGLLYSYYLPYGLTYPNQTFASKCCDFYVGVCQNTGYSDPNPTDAVVATPNQENCGLGANNPWISINPQATSIVWKYGSNPEVRVNGGTSNTYAALYPVRGQYFFDFSFNQSTFSVNVYGASNSAAASVDVTRAAFLDNMEARTMSNVGSWGAPSVAYAGNFSLGNMCVYWRRSCPTFLISEICVTRFY